MNLISVKSMEQNGTLNPAQEIITGTLEWQFREFVILMSQKRENLLNSHGITESDIDIIRYLNMNEVKKMKDLGDAFSLKFSTLTSTVDRLESNRLVKRKSSKEDRRVVFVVIAPRGRTFLQELSNLYIDATQKIKQQMTTEQEKMFYDSLAGITGKA
ncbi:MAG: MarR family transcriptional regulator [Bacteroidia bacterium]|nr:MarR family transcriptional regulator [Bacteroidia bacterium]